MSSRPLEAGASGRIRPCLRFRPWPPRGWLQLRSNDQWWYARAAAAAGAAVLQPVLMAILSKDRGKGPRLESLVTRSRFWLPQGGRCWRLLSAHNATESAVCWPRNAAATQRGRAGMVRRSPRWHHQLRPTPTPFSPPSVGASLGGLPLLRAIEAPALRQCYWAAPVWVPWCIEPSALQVSGCSDLARVAAGHRLRLRTGQKPGPHTNYASSAWFTHRTRGVRPFGGSAGGGMAFDDRRHGSRAYWEARLSELNIGRRVVLVGAGPADRGEPLYDERPCRLSEGRLIASGSGLSPTPELAGLAQCRPCLAPPATASLALRRKPERWPEARPFRSDRPQTTHLPPAVPPWPATRRRLQGSQSRPGGSQPPPLRPIWPRSIGSGAIGSGPARLNISTTRFQLLRSKASERWLRIGGRRTRWGLTPGARPESWRSAFHRLGLQGHALLRLGLTGSDFSHLHTRSTQARGQDAIRRTLQSGRGVARGALGPPR